MRDDKPFYVIAIDGAAASGKSSTSRVLADDLNLMHVDTGAHYRAVTLCLLKAQLDPSNVDEIDTFLASVPLETEVSAHRALIRINRYLPHETELRSAAVNEAVSGYAALPCVRDFLKDYQRGALVVAKNHHFNGVVMEGRDIGSVILPDAPYRFYLHADAQVRTERRAQEGETDIVTARDKLDMNRKSAPLVKAEGAIDIDTSRNSLEEVVAFIKNYLKQS